MKKILFTTSKGNEVDLLELAQLIDVSPEEHDEIATKQLQLVSKLSVQPSGTWLETENGQTCIRLQSQAHIHSHIAFQKSKQ